MGPGVALHHFLTHGRARRRDVLSLLGMRIGMSLAASSLPAASEKFESLADWMRASRSARKDALASCLERIQRMDPSLHAWVQVLPQPQVGDGPLAGIPFGVKDIIETRNLVTEYGSPIYQGRHGSADAAIVRRLQSLGAILVGKTQAAAFAYRTPPPTRNPRDLEHTPGGSSSGSAAAVAAGMVPIAIGTQTIGSVLRPASYCGVTGFKASFGLLPMDGVLPFAHSLDTLGFFTPAPSDMLLLWEALGHPIGRKEDFALGKVSLGVVEPLPEVEPPMAAAFRETIARLRKRGIGLRPVPIAPMLNRLAEEATVVEFYEGARFHQQRFKQYGDRLLDLADLVRSGLKIPDQRYRAALSFIAESKARMAEHYETTSVILAPAATGPAPRGLASTGDGRMNSPWTALGTPAISVPMRVSQGLPVGIQLTAAHGQDARVLQMAAQLAPIIGFA